MGCCVYAAGISLLPSLDADEKHHMEHLIPASLGWLRKGNAVDTFFAFAMGNANRDKERMVFDWNKAATIIKERNAQSASAGLNQDWEYTGGDILRDGQPVPADDTYVYLASTWAEPQLFIDGEYMDCYVMEPEANGHDEHTYWPDAALKILGVR